MTSSAEYGTVDATKQNDSADRKAGGPPQRHRHWKILTLGQGLSILLASMLATQSTIFLDCGWSSPGLSCTWAYLLLSLNLIPLYLRGRAIRRKSGSDEQATIASDGQQHWFLFGLIPLHASPWIYFGMSALSFYGNYLNILAIRYTTITSITLFDALSIPTAMILSRLLLKRRYIVWHFLAAGLCIVGIMLNVGIDVVSNYLHATNQSDKDDGSEEYPHKLLGDIMACGGGIMWGANDVMAELSVRRYGGATEYLAMMGFFSVFIGIAQTSIFERDSAADLFLGSLDCAGGTMAWLLTIYTLGQFSRKAGLAFFLTMSDAALLQLSLLTSDLYTAIFSVIYQGIFPRALFWVAITLVISGIVVYEMGPSPIVTPEDGIMESSCNVDKDGIVWFDVNQTNDDSGKNDTTVPLSPVDEEDKRENKKLEPVV